MYRYQCTSTRPWTCVRTPCSMLLEYMYVLKNTILNTIPWNIDNIAILSVLQYGIVPTSRLEYTCTGTRVYTCTQKTRALYTCTRVLVCVMCECLRRLLMPACIVSMHSYILHDRQLCKSASDMEMLLSSIPLSVFRNTKSTHSNKVTN